MAEASKDTDQSMEDILQSIKRIIADEGEPSPAMGGSDVLELTDLLAEDTAVPEVEPPEEAPEPEAPSVGLDEIMAAPASTPTEPPPTAAPVKKEAAPPAPKPDPTPAVPVSDGLMSDSTLSASLAALNALNQPSVPSAMSGATGMLAFRSGTTVEDLVLEALKPMLKDWIDNNLPRVVTNLVEKEIRRLSQQG